MLPYLLDVPTPDVLHQRAAQGWRRGNCAVIMSYGLLPQSITKWEASNRTLLSCSSGDQKCDIDVLAGLTPFGGSEDNPSSWPSTGDSHPGHPLASTHITLISVPKVTWGSSLYLPTTSSLCACVCTHISFFFKDTSHLRRVPPTPV